MLTLKELANQTGLSENVIRKYLRLLGSFLRPYIKRGQSNKLLFDPNCVVIFSEIKQQKDQGKTAKEITSFLKKGCVPEKEISYQELSVDQAGQTQDPAQQIQELYQMLLEEKEKRIRDRDERELKIVRAEMKNVKLRELMKQLPEGKTPFRIRKEWDQAERNAEMAGDIIEELQGLSVLRFMKRKKLLAKLAELLT
jgi:DNA-binding transcriptional MerR regulator